MKIGLCGYPIQSPSTSTRGIGRYTSDFIKSLIHCSPNDEFVVYMRGTPADGHSLESFMASHPNAITAWLEENTSNRNCTLDAIASNPHKLDWLILTSPHESHVSKHGKIPRIATVIYDLIPLRFPGYFLDPPEMAGYKHAFETYLKAARDYDRLLAISESTKSDFVDLGGFKPEQITVTGAGVNPRFKPRGLAWTYPNWLKETLGERPYVLHVGGMDPRKGAEMLMHAWKSLPKRIRSMHRLVYAYEMDSHYSFQMRQLASLNGLNFEVEFLGYVAEDRLVDLYQNARVMCLPSKAEGLGMPLLESMACGVPVIAGKNTGQIEAMGPGGMLVNPDSPDAVTHLAHGLEMLLDDVPLRDRLGRLGLEHSRQFAWEAVAARTHDCLLREAQPRSSGQGRRREAPGALPDDPGGAVVETGASKPALAFFGLVPPCISGTVPIGLTLAQALTEFYKVTFYHNPAAKAQGKNEWGSAFAGVLPGDAYDGCPRRVHQFGNSEYHTWQIPLIQRKGGVVTLHDANLDGLWRWLTEHQGFPQAGDWHDLLLSFDPERTWFTVHSQTAFDVISEVICLGNSPLAHYGIIPPPVAPNILSADARMDTRRQLNLPMLRDTAGRLLLLGCGGLVHASKMPQIVLAAYRLARGRCERDGVQLALAMIGPEGDGGVTREVASRWGVDDVHWTGPLASHKLFADAMACCDMAIQLREPPTNGETSGALLDAMRAGVPAIVSNVGAFSEYPDDVVVKVSPSPFQVSDVARVLACLATDEMARETLAMNAMNHLLRHNDPAQVAAQYRAIIEHSVEAK